MKKRVGAKLEMARFLQDTVAEMAKDMKGSKSGATQASAEQLYQFLKKVSRRLQLLHSLGPGITMCKYHRPMSGAPFWGPKEPGRHRGQQASIQQLC